MDLPTTSAGKNVTQVKITSYIPKKLTLSRKQEIDKSIDSIIVRGDKYRCIRGHGEG